MSQESGNPPPGAHGNPDTSDPTPTNPTGLAAQAAPPAQAGWNQPPVQPGPYRTAPKRTPSAGFLTRGRRRPPASWPRRGRRWWITGIVVVVVVAAAGVTWWLWPSGTRAVPGTVQATVLSAEDVGKALGQTLQSEHSISEPPPALLSDPANCAVAVGPVTQAVYAPGWTTFGSVTYQDSDSEADHTVTQVIGVYPSGDEAGEVFGMLAEGVKGCTSAVRAGGDSGKRASKWSYTVDNATPEAVSWTATQDMGDGWACSRQARLKGGAVLQVAVCQAGDGSQAAATIADQFASRVSG